MINISKLASVSLSNIKGLPVNSGVYLIIDSASRVWYIGSSSNLRQRLSTHDKLDDFSDIENCLIAYIPCDDFKEQEAELITHFDPPMNSKNDNRKYALPYVKIDGLSPQQCLDRYAEIKELIKTLEQEAEQLKPNVVTYIQENANDERKFVGKNLRAWLTNRPVYKFSPEVEKLEKKLKEMKKAEQDNGTAVVVKISTYPTIKLI